MAARLKTQQDGRKLAIRIMRRLYKVGADEGNATRKERDPQSGELLQYRAGPQADPLMKAMVELQARGTAQAAIGFAVVMTDFLTEKLSDDSGDFYQRRENARKLEHWKG